jgi:hypothetical protein
MVSCDTDLRPGGRYRFVFRSPDGNEVGFSGEFREVVVPSRIVRTFVFEPMPDAAAVETLELVEHDGKTTSKTTTLHKTVENRDGHVQWNGSGMTQATPVSTNCSPAFRRADVRPPGLPRWDRPTCRQARGSRRRNTRPSSLI